MSGEGSELRSRARPAPYPPLNPRLVPKRKTFANVLNRDGAGFRREENNISQKRRKSSSSAEGQTHHPSPEALRRGGGAPLRHRSVSCQQQSRRGWVEEHPHLSFRKRNRPVRGETGALLPPGAARGSCLPWGAPSPLPRLLLRGFPPAPLRPSLTIRLLQSGD